MLFEKHKTYYVLQHESGKYFKISSLVTSMDDYLTADVLEASRYILKPIAETAITNMKNVVPKWGAEMYLQDVMTHCTVKKLVIDLKGYIDD